jgi:hypothetical protein
MMIAGEEDYMSALLFFDAGEVGDKFEDQRVGAHPDRV